jgi:hypothetical protein
VGAGAQEVRTADLYRVDGEVLYSKQQVADGGHADSGKPLLTDSPLAY